MGKRRKTKPPVAGPRALAVRPPARARNRPEMPALAVGHRDLAAISEWVRENRQALKAMRGSYRATNNPRSRNAISWPVSGDAHADVLSRRYAREDSRNLERNAGCYASLLAKAVRLIVAEGIRTRPTSASASWNNLAAAYIHRKFSSADQGLDCRGMRSWYELQATFVTSVIRDGDAGLLKLANGQLQMYESEQIDGGDPSSVPGASQVVGGVALSDSGRPTAYHLRPYGIDGSGYGQTALATGEWFHAKDFLFAAIATRYSQTRGMPGLVATLDSVERVDSYQESEIIAAEQGSQIYGALEYPPGVEPTNGGIIPGDENQNGTGIDGGRNADGTIDWQPTVAGSLLVLPRGIKYVPVNPQRPNKDSEPFAIFLLRSFASVLGLPYEVAFDDLRGLSWSTSRSLISSARATILHWQNNLLRHVLTHVYQWTIARGIQLGELPPIEDWKSHEHEWPEIAWPDPLKEVAAQAAQVTLGTTSVQRIVGHQWRAILDEQAGAQVYRDQLFVARVVAAHRECEKAIKANPGLVLDWAKVIASTGAMSAPAAYLTAVAASDAANAEPEEKPAPAAAGGAHRG